MEPNDSANTTMTDLLAAVGQFLLCWGWLENALESRPVPHNLETIRKMRNTMCHGLRMAHANPWEDASTAYVECRAQDGEMVKYTLADIRAAIRCLREACVSETRSE